VLNHSGVLLFFFDWMVPLTARFLMEAKRFYKTNLLFTSLLWRVRPSSGRKYFMQVPQLFNGETLQAGFRKSGIVY